MAKKPSVILREAAERIRFGRWMQHSEFDGKKLRELGADQVRVCAYGAIDYASEMPNWAHPENRRTHRRYLAWVAARDYARNATPSGLIATFNDLPGMTMTRVREVLLEAADNAARDGV